MPKWNVDRNGPNWLMDADGRLYGYRDKRGVVRSIAQIDTSDAQAEALTVPDKSVEALVSSPISIASQMVIGKLGAPVTRVSANAAPDTSFTTAFSCVLPGGSIGSTGRVLLSVEFEFTAPELAASAALFAWRIGSTTLHPIYSPTVATHIVANLNFIWYADSATTQRYRTSIVKDGSHQGIPLGTPWVTTAVDTSIDQTISFDWRWDAATAGDTFLLRAATVAVEYGA